MGKFLDNFRMKLAPLRTKYMGKKIKFMDDYLGFTKKLLKQMESDAVFFKTCETQFYDAYIQVSCSRYSSDYFEEAVETLSITKPAYKNIFEQLYAHKINWYYMGDKDISNFASCTNKKLDEFKQKYENTIYDLFHTTRRQVKDTREYEDDSTPITEEKRHKFLLMLKQHQSTCRYIKRKIKILFEIKKKQFEKSAKTEETSLKKLNELTKDLTKALKALDFTDALNIWTKAENWYAEHQTTYYRQPEKLTTKTHLIAKNYISNFIKTKLRTLCNDINKKLESYIEAYEGKESYTLTYKDHSTLNNLYTTLEGLILQCLNADQNTLESIGISEPQLTPLRTYMYQAVYPFLYPSGQINICDINIDAYMHSVNDILKQWKYTYKK